MLEVITTYDVEKWLLEFAAKGLSNLTANVNLTVLNVMMTKAIRRGLLESNPVEKVSPLKKATRERDILTADEVSRIFNYESIVAMKFSLFSDTEVSKMKKKQVI